MGRRAPPVQEFATTPPLPYLDAGSLTALLTAPQALQAVQTFFATHDRAAVTVPHRIHLAVPQQPTVGLYMPAATPRFIGLKLAHILPHRKPAVEAEAFLFDADSGRLLLWGDGKALTALRTAAVSVAASLRLKPRCETMAIFGTGTQAVAHITAFASAYPELKRIWSVARTVASYFRMEGALPPESRELVRLSENPHAHLAGCDCVVTATPARAPLFAWEQVPPGCLVVGVGSATPEMNELPSAAFLGSAVWVDSPNAVVESGDLLQAAQAGWRKEAVTGDLHDLLTPGYDPAPAVARSDQGQIVFKSVGHAAQDLALLIRLWENHGSRGAS
jgi:ornithine cyclodeaminase